ncbi:antitoxin Phd [Nocardia farcinica]|uniref:antitoxin Phd n=1 Tax=Nocardia TaxID=1817 RepID=UPI0018955E10|nr:MULTISPECIES: antitoxin Phd [Nocardia]MBF6215643.1 antitoxin Phd [Nocardia puris]MBF6422386.1 antitoxin Phd [Nocardia farcinica]MBF6434087.1 antitoxin Phd [Nocardia farcinica]MBF6505143.1 antitoxin Phd [Nocardia farcinica]
MPALNISFTDDELETIRAAAERQGVSLRVYAHTAITQAANEQNRRVEEIAMRVATKSAELNRRLA